MGPDARSLLLTVSMIVIPEILFCAFISQRLINEFPHHLDNLIVGISVAFTVYVSFLSFVCFYLVLTDLFLLHLEISCTTKTFTAINDRKIIGYAHLLSVIPIWPDFFNKMLIEMPVDFEVWIKLGQFKVKFEMVNKSKVYTQSFPGHSEVKEDLWSLSWTCCFNIGHIFIFLSPHDRQLTSRTSSGVHICIDKLHLFLFFNLSNKGWF